MKRCFCFILTIVMVVGVFFCVPVSGDNVFAGGTGTENDPFLIETTQQLNNVRYNLNAHYKLINDIEFTEDDFKEDGAFYNYGQGWVPIGTDYNTPFMGYFDGNYYSIQNLYINVTQVPESCQVFAGLFGYGDGCTIKNLSLTNTIIKVDVEDAAVSVGAIIGYVDEFGDGATIIGCSNDGDLYASCGHIGGIAGAFEKGTLTNCENYGSIDTLTAGVGGIIGYLNKGVITECQNFSTIGGQNTYASCGGIVADSWGDIISCNNFGSIISACDAAGIARSSWGLVDNCSNTGNIKAKYSAGGITAVSGAIQTGDTTCGVTNCTNNGSIIAGIDSDDMYRINAGGIAGSIQNGIIILNSWNYGDISSQSEEVVDCHSGGIVGYNSGGSIIKCGNTADVIIKTPRYARGGGIVGCNCGGNINILIDQCYNSGTVYAPDGTNGVCGGIAGDNFDTATITNCFNIGSVISSSRPGGIVGLTYNDNVNVGQCYNTGVLTTLTPNSWIGGDNTPNITNCFYLDTPILSSQEVIGYGAGIGIVPEDMLNDEVFTGFDFYSIWTMGGNAAYLYPELRALPLDYKKEIIGISIISEPQKTEYLENKDVIDTSGGKLLVHYNGMREIIDIDDSMIVDFNNTIIGQQTVIVQYNGFTDDFDVMIKCNPHDYDNDCDDLCNDCGEIRAITHTYISKISVFPTCENKGEEVYSCSCGESYTKIIPATGHTVVKDPAVAATCTKTGKTEGSHCSVCNTVIKAQTVVPVKSHTPSAWKTNASTRTKYKECTVCKKVLESQKIPLAAPTINSCYNEVDGVQLGWTAVGEATSYRVYRKLPADKNWTLLTTTSARTYRDKKVSGNVAYQYSVKALDKNNNESDFSALKENRYIEFPQLLSRASAVGGVQITWQKVAGATSYRIYRRGAASNTWSFLGEVPATQSTFLDKEGTAKNQIKSGNYYRYTVRASYSGKDSFAKDHLRYSGFDTNGLYLKYMATPKLTSISNAGAGNTEGIKITWNKVNGGGTTWYRVYRRGANSSNWRYLGATQGNTWTDKETKNYSGNYYRYTVRAVAGTQDTGWYSAFDTNGLYIKRIANPTLKSATSAKAGITVKWSAVKGTTGYYVYRKTATSGWQCVGTVKGTNNVTFLDKTAKKGTTYTYTVRACYGTTKSYFNSGIKCYDKY